MIPDRFIGYIDEFHKIGGPEPYSLDIKDEDIPEFIMHVGRISGLNIQQAEVLLGLCAKSGNAKLPSTDGVFPDLFSRMKIRSVINTDNVITGVHVVKEHLLFFTDNASVIFANSDGFNEKCVGIRLDSPISDHFYSAANSVSGELISFQTSNVTMLCDTRVHGFNIVQLIFDAAGKAVAGHHIDDQHKWVIFFCKDTPGVEIHRIEPVDFGTNTDGTPKERTFEDLLKKTVSTRINYEVEGKSPGIIGAASFSADSKHMVTVGSAMRHAKFLLWDMTPSDGKFTFTALPIRINKPVTSISFSEDGEYLVFSTTSHLFTYSVASLTRKEKDDKENKFVEPLLKTELIPERSVFLSPDRKYCAFIEKHASPIVIDQFNVNMDQLSVVRLGTGEGTQDGKHKNILRHPMSILNMGRASRFDGKHFLCEGLIFGREYITVYDCETGLTLMHAKPNFGVPLCKFRALLWENNALVQVSGFDKSSLSNDSPVSSKIEKSAYIHEERPAAHALDTEKLLMLELLYLRYLSDKNGFEKKYEKEILSIPEEYYGMFSDNKYNYSESN